MPCKRCDTGLSTRRERKFGLCDEHLKARMEREMETDRWPDAPASV